MILCVQWNTDYGLLPLCLFFCFFLALSFFLSLRFWLVLFVGSLFLSHAVGKLCFFFFLPALKFIYHTTQRIISILMARSHLFSSSSFGLLLFFCSSVASTTLSACQFIYCLKVQVSASRSSFRLSVIAHRFALCLFIKMIRLELIALILSHSCLICFPTVSVPNSEVSPDCMLHWFNWIVIECGVHAIKKK